MRFVTKPRGDQLSFLTECYRCRAEISISNARPDPHTCRVNTDWHADMAAYYESGANGAPPKHPLDDRKS